MKLFLANTWIGLSYAAKVVLVMLLFVVVGVTIMAITASLCVYLHPVAGLIGFIACFAVVQRFSKD